MNETWLSGERERVRLGCKGVRDRFLIEYKKYSYFSNECLLSYAFSSVSSRYDDLGGGVISSRLNREM